MSDREERIASLRAELESLEAESDSDTESAINEAEEVVDQAAEEANEGTESAHETIEEAQQEIEEAVDNAAEEAHEATGVSAEAIADHLFNRLEAAGRLPRHSADTVAHESTIEGDVPGTGETPAEVQAEVTEVVPDEPPEASHFWYRERKLLGRRR